MWSLFLYRIRAFADYYRKAKTRYNIQSLFQHNLVTDVLENHGQYYCFQEIEKFRKEFQKDQQIIHVRDYGAGPAIKSSSPTTTVASIASKSLSPPRKCELLFHLARYSKAKHILELGTSLGISTAYLASANSKAEVVTMEGNPEIANKARGIFQRGQLQNIRQVVGPFGENLNTVLQEMPRLDFVFLDGHHAKEPTLLYFEKTVARCHENSVLVVDDIHWSANMQEAWTEIQRHPKVTLSIDLFYMGIIFLNPTLTKEHVSFISFWKKLWNIGLFGK